MTEFKLISLADLAISPLNARFGRDVATDDLETSIAGAGRLVTPLGVYAEAGKHLVWDGGRRLLALQKLAKARQLPGSLGSGGVPCFVAPSAEAARVDSLATFVREGMTAGDEFLAIRAMVGAGLSITETAAALNLRTARVGQLQRLVNLAPEVLDAFTAGKIPLDVAEAFTLSEDHDRQREVFKAFNPKRDNGWGVRQAFRKAALDGDDQLARFVGRDAYAAAGGRFLTDLFDNRGQEDWIDRELAELVRKVEAEGWQEVEASYRRPGDWSYNCPFDRLPGKKDTFTLEQKAGAKAIIFIRHNGEVEIERGLVKKAAKRKLNADGTEAKIDQALHGFGHGGHEVLTSVATAAVQVAVALDPAAAYDAVLTSLAWTAFHENGRNNPGDNGTHDANAASLRVDERGYGFQKAADVAGMPELLALAKTWLARLPAERLAFCDYVAALTPDEKAALLAISFAWSLNAVEHRHDYMRRPRRWAHLGWIGRRAGVDINAAWTPDLEFLKKGSREALGEALKQMGGASVAGKESDFAKKGDLVAHVGRTAQQARWVPKLLADLFAKPAAPAGPKAEKAAKGSKRMFKDALGDQIAALASDDAGEAAPVAEQPEAPQT